MKLSGDKLAAVMTLKQFARRAAKSALNNEKQLAESKSRKTILREIVRNKNNPKFGAVSQRRLEDESLSLIAASADTVGNALTMATYQILKNPSIHKRLFAELQEAIPNSLNIPGFAELEKLPYLVFFYRCGYLFRSLLTRNNNRPQSLRKPCESRMVW
jgi:cytochrome P450